VIIAGVLLIGIAVGLVFALASKKKKIALMESTETSTVEFLKKLSQSMVEGVGAGTLFYFTEVKGKVASAAPLASELAGMACVHYVMQVNREFEETYFEKNERGEQIQKTRTEVETVASNRRSIAFSVDDGTGHIRVEPDGASIIAEKVLSRFEPSANQAGGTLKVGNFSLSLPQNLREGDRRTLGYRFEESAIPVGKEVYVIGEVNEQNGELVLRRPREKGRFIISTQSEEELVRREASAIKWFGISAIVLALIGIGLILYAVLAPQMAIQ